MDEVRAEAAAPAPRRRYGGKSAEQRRVERRDALVAAALEIWQESGWAAVTMRGVCARAGLTDRYFYESFADRDALLATVWDQMRDETLAMLLDAILPHADGDPLDQLHAALSAVVHHIGDEPQRAQ
ncbi:MAG TPA: TetR/AcrR family transcriptional regulator, partial [Nocardioides sp.]|nr:TetR/AcrR family transcriptional regulator [Nocardioides sp.]